MKSYAVRTEDSGAGSSPPLNSFGSKRNSVWSVPFVISLFVVTGLTLISVFTGVYDIRGQEDGLRMLLITRIPRTMALILSGIAMSMSGLVMQLITQNKMVEASTTGTTEWGGLGLLIVYLLIPAPTLVQRMTGAIVFSFFGTMFFFLILRKIKLKSSLIVPIVGMMLGAVVSAFSTFLGLTFQATQTISSWFVGSFSSVQIGRYEYLWFILVICIAVYLFSDRLTLAGLGEDVSKTLGVNYNRTVMIGTALISLSVGIVTAVIGNLPFLGLIVPNIVTMFRGDQLRTNLPWVCVVGMGVIMLCDIVSRTIIMPFEVPVSLILGTVGSVMFIVILLRQRRRP